MAAEYSYPLAQTVAEDENIIFLDGDRACRKGYITHRSGSGVFRLKGAGNACKTVYRVTFNANIAVAPAADGGVVGPISVAIQEDGETLQNAIATVTPTVAEAFFNVSLTTFIVIPCGCCVTISVENVSVGTAGAAGSAIDVTNANIIFDRVA
ncbi:MAG: hypothetical protein U0M02_06890 [Acutalibacteraceae bacterium]|nr:hypothetical protein [Acutalibacteraceae bacterium]